MFLFLQMCEHQTLPVNGKLVRRTVTPELKSGPPRKRFEQQMHLCIMPKRLEMAHPFHTIINGFLIQNPACAKVQLVAKTLPHNTLQNFRLHIAHQMHMNFL